MFRSATEITLSYCLFKMLRVKVYGVLMKKFSVSWGLANGSLFRKRSSLGRMMLWS